MVNFRDPAVIAQDNLAVTKLWHAMIGLYFWEFFTTLEYEWSVIRGRLPYRWTIWIYSVARVATLLALIFGLVLMDHTSPINCQVTLSFAVVLPILTMAAASLLIVLRVIAVWNRNKIVVAIAISIWVINIAFLIQGASRFRPLRLPGGVCASRDIKSSILNIISMLVADVALLLIMLVGLLRVRRHGGGKFGLSQLLWKQGLIWLLIATVVEVPPVVFDILNLNDPLSIMFQPPAYTVMAIAATRMHRSLVDFVTGSTEVVSENLPNVGLPDPKAKRSHAVPITFSPMEVAMHTVSEQHSTLQMGYDDSRASTQEQVNGLGLGDDVERGV